MANVAVCFAFVFVLVGYVACDCDINCQRQCTTKLIECQGAAMGHSQGGGSAVPEGNYGNGPSGGSPDICVDPPKDQCKAVQEAVVCLDKLTQCKDAPSFKQISDMMRSTKMQVCNPMLRCQTQLQKCQCIVTGAANSTQAEFFTRLCSKHAEFTECMDDVPEDCLKEAAVSFGIQFARDIFDSYHKLVCDPDTGACPEALMCLQQLSSGPAPDTSGPPMPQLPSVDFSQFCPKMSVFDCLDKASATCDLDQGSVTMIQVKEAATEMCTGAFSRSVMSLESCLNCKETLPGMKDMMDAVAAMNRDGMPDQKTLTKLMHFMAQTTRTGFWCQWMQNLYQCTIDKADTCSVPQDIVTIATTKKQEVGGMCVGAATVPPPNGPGKGVAVQASAVLVILSAMLMTFV